MTTRPASHEATQAVGTKPRRGGWLSRVLNFLRMASLWVRTCCARGEVVLAGLIAIIASSTAWADGAKTVPDVPRFKFFVSSHSTAAAEVITYWATGKAAGIGQEVPKPSRPGWRSRSDLATSSYPTQWGVKKGLPEVVLIGGLEGRIYRCDCGKDIHLWEVAEGTRLWAVAEGLKVKTEARVLRASTGCGPLTSGSPSPGADRPSATPPTAAPLDFDYYRMPDRGCVFVFSGCGTEPRARTARGFAEAANRGVSLPAIAVAATAG